MPRARQPRRSSGRRERRCASATSRPRWPAAGAGTGAAEAKLGASEAGLRVCDLALQLHGGRGYTEEGEVHRHWRDARLMTIGEGTSEILRLVIAKFALKGGPHDQG